MKMKITKNNILIGMCLFLFVLNLIPLSQSQTFYQTYFWITETDQELSALCTTGDLNSDQVQLSEVIVGGRGNVTLLDGFSGSILSNYSIATTFSYTSLAVGNLDADSMNEFIAGSIDGNHLIALDYDNITEKLTKIWEKNKNVSQIQVVDLVGDSKNEVIVGETNGNLTVFNKDGILLWNVTITEPLQKLQCLDFSQDNIIDRILILTNKSIILFNNTGHLKWQATVPNIPLNGLVGDVQGDTTLELIVKGQNITYCFNQTGNWLWNSTLYSSESPGIVLYNSSQSQKFEILISGISGSYLLNGTDGSLIRSYLTNSSVTSLAIGEIFGGTVHFLVMGDRNRNLTIWNMDPDPTNELIYQLMNITLSGPIVDVILIDMNNDDILDIITASSNGTVYVIGLPWLININWVLVGIAIGCAIIIVSIIIVIKMKTPSELQRVSYHTT